MTILAVARRELSATFATASGWLVLTSFLWLAGAFWVFALNWYVETAMDIVFDPYAATSLNFRDHLVTPFFGNITIVLLMLCPAISMRLFAEEYRQHTMELLYTSPIGSAEIVLGKFLGASSVAGVMLLGTAWMPLSLYRWGSPDLLAITTGYLALWILCATIIAMGMLFSSVTENQIIAFVLTVAAALGLLLASWFAESADSWLGQLSFMTHIQDMLRGAVRLSDLTWFACAIGWLLFATHQQVESHRWS